MIALQRMIIRVIWISTTGSYASYIGRAINVHTQVSAMGSLLAVTNYHERMIECFTSTSNAWNKIS